MYKLMYESSFLLTDMYMYMRKLEKYTCTLYINIYLHADLYTHTHVYRLSMVIYTHIQTCIYKIKHGDDNLF